MTDKYAGQSPQERHSNEIEDQWRFDQVAGTNATRLTFDEARELLELPLEQRPRVYCLWNAQIVRAHSVQKLIQYWPATFIWTKTTTIHDMVRRA